MKRFVPLCLFAALLLSVACPLCVSAETPEDFAEHLVAYWDFEAYRPLNDKGDANTFDNTLTAGSCVLSAGNENYNKVDENAEITIADGRATVPAALGHALTSRVSSSGDDIGNLQSMTLGLKVNVDASSAGGAMVWRTNAFALMVQTYDKDTDSYTLQYRSEANAATGYAGDPFGGKAFSCGKDYYLFLTAEAKNDRTVTVTGYWSEDGASFTKGDELTLSVSAAVTAGYLWRAGANASKIILGKAQNTYVLKGASFTFDDVWIYDTAVSEESLPVIAQARVRRPGGNVDGGPAYAGCQLSSVREDRFDVRFVGTVNSLDYAEVGFEIQVTDCAGASGEARLYTTTTVYETLLGTENGPGGSVTYTAQDLGGSHLFALAVRGVPADTAVTFRITPWFRAEADAEAQSGESWLVVVRGGSLVSQSTQA